MNDKPRLFPADWQDGNSYSNMSTFAMVPGSRDMSKADVAIIGMPLDLGTSFRSGTRYGPKGIRQASTHIRKQTLDMKDMIEPFKSLRIVDYGDVKMPLGYIELAVERVEAAVAEVLQGETFPVCLGGDHTISLPILRALYKKYGKISLVHIDAHPDFWEPEDPDRPYSHGTMFYMATQEGIMDPHSSVQVGIRGGDSLAKIPDARAAGITSITGDEFWHMGPEETAEVIKKTTEGRPVHISFDIDSVDPAYAPGTGTPEVAGLTSRESLALVRSLDGIGAVGFDIVEVSPPYDPAEITSLLAANLIYEFLLTLLPETPMSNA